MTVKINAKNEKRDGSFWIEGLERIVSRGVIFDCGERKTERERDINLLDSPRVISSDFNFNLTPQADFASSPLPYFEDRQ